MSPTPSSAQITRLLADWGQGNLEIREAPIPVVYDELQRLAHHYLRRERPDHTLQSCALVSEAYLRLAGQPSPPWRNRTHFFGVAAQMMRHILVDHARNRRAAKRDAGAPRLTPEGDVAFSRKPEVDLLALDEVLNRLTAMDPRQGRLVEMRFFGGLSVEETALVMDISPATVKREWATAKVWLRHELGKEAPK